MDSPKVSRLVTPAKAGVYKLLILLDPGFRRDDVERRFWTFYESINLWSGQNGFPDFEELVEKGCGYAPQ
jgi:hypothetical protein